MSKELHNASSMALSGAGLFLRFLMLSLLWSGVACGTSGAGRQTRPPADGKRRLIDQVERVLFVAPNPSRIISLAPSVTEILFALGVEDRVVGVTNFCHFPDGVKPKTRIGDLQNPNLEVIVSLRPDLVIATTSGNVKESIDKMAELNLAVYTLNASTLEEILRSIRDVGDITGTQQKAAAVVGDLRRRLLAVRQRGQGRPTPRVLYLIWHDPIVAPGGDSFITDGLRWAGGDSITADTKARSPRYSAEEIIAKQPEYIFVPKGENPVTLSYFLESPGWATLPAVIERRIYFISPAIQQPSPKLIDGIEEVAGILHGPP
ncbi:MAG: cobalamin-binding protein [Acidobacteria bacterium]|nr:cobalamin-binding protein [Acidobacteriota bacterium]MBI3655719.1 cobalamin-binding protein [Acidobacteriota bacterium]